jgi:hypothetical protein
MAYLDDASACRTRQAQDGYRGFGKTFQQCVLGEVSERCGGSLI